MLGHSLACSEELQERDAQWLQLMCKGMFPLVDPELEPGVLLSEEPSPMATDLLTASLEFILTRGIRLCSSILASWEFSSLIQLGSIDDGVNVYSGGRMPGKSLAYITRDSLTGLMGSPNMTRMWSAVSSGQCSRHMVCGPCSQT